MVLQQKVSTFILKQQLHAPARICVTTARIACSSRYSPCAICSILNAGKRNYQQDRHIAIPDFKPDHGGDDQVNCCLVGVFDGHKSEQAAVLAAAKMPGIIAARKLSSLMVL